MAPSGVSLTSLNASLRREGALNDTDADTTTLSENGVAGWCRRFRLSDGSDGRRVTARNDLSAAAKGRRHLRRPQYIVEDLLLAEGFTDIRCVELPPTPAATIEAVARGEID